MLSEKQLANRLLIAKASVECEKDTGFPAELSAAQAIVESGWLMFLPPDSNNCFGIKDTDRYPGAVYTMTHEWRQGKLVPEKHAFEKYPSLRECFVDHAWLIMKGRPYKVAWFQYQEDHDLFQLIRSISPKYAPNNPTYIPLVTKIANDKELIKIIKEFRDAKA